MPIQAEHTLWSRDDGAFPAIGCCHRAFFDDVLPAAAVVIASALISRRSAATTGKKYTDAFRLRWHAAMATSWQYTKVIRLHYGADDAAALMTLAFAACWAFSACTTTRLHTRRQKLADREKWPSRCRFASNRHASTGFLGAPFHERPRLHAAMMISRRRRKSIWLARRAIYTVPVLSHRPDYF